MDTIGLPARDELLASARERTYARIWRRDGRSTLVWISKVDRQNRCWKVQKLRLDVGPCMTEDDDDEVAGFDDVPRPPCDVRFEDIASVRFYPHASAALVEEQVAAIEPGAFLVIWGHHGEGIYPSVEQGYLVTVDWIERELVLRDALSERDTVVPFDRILAIDDTRRAPRPQSRRGRAYGYQGRFRGGYVLRRRSPMRSS